MEIQRIEMKNSISFKMIRRLIYLLIGLPLSILAILGVRVGKLIQPKEIPQRSSYNYLSSDTYTLFDYTSGDDIGEIEIKSIAEDNIIVRVNGNSVSGTDEVFDKKYKFKNISIDEFVLNKEQDKEEIYWCGTNNGINVVIINVFNKSNYQPIIQSLYKDNCEYFLFSVLNDYDYNYIKKGMAVIPIREKLINSRYSSVFSGIFYLEKQ
jgi:hypothetical protein